MNLPAGPFDLIYADPPLHFTTWSDKGQGRSPSRHYATMSAPALLALPVTKLAAPDSVLALWVYGPRLPDALALIAGTCWVGYIVLSQRVGSRFTGIDGLAIALAFGTVLVIPAGLVEGGHALL